MPHKNLETSNDGVKKELQQLPSASFKNSQQLSNTTEICINFNTPLYGMSPEQYIEGLRYHNECFHKLNSL